jgi:hypothetical protein
MKRAVSGPGVRLKRHPPRWRCLPVAIRRQLAHQPERVARIRISIATAWPVGWMPPIEIVDVAWVIRGGVAWAGSGLLRSASGCWPAVILSAPAPLVLDNPTLRAVLVHEFSHAFNLITRLVERGLRRRSRGNGAYTATRRLARVKRPSSIIGRSGSRHVGQKSPA